MGNTGSMKSDDWENLKRVTGLPIKELKALHKEFHIGFPNGKMSKEDYLKINNQHDNQSTEDFVSTMFDAFDKDKNGYIDFTEYAVVIGIKKNGSLNDKILLAFNMFDIDGNGTIEYDEMLKLISSLFKMIASKSHGDNPKVMEKMESQAKERVDHIFSKMDVNGDGELTLEEFTQGCHRDKEISRALLNIQNKI
mmetsp:Transcript_9918/g.14614  ORF Transcript_9918/g.14614 Transcript_9918/m.14614 type:complete len:195 (-) Transcript_9918:78-662(-)